MDKKFVLLAGVVVLIAFIIYYSGTRVDDIGDPHVPKDMANTATEKSNPHGHSKSPAGVDLPEVKSVVLTAKNSDGKSWEEIKLSTGIKYKIPGTGTEIVATDFYTQWNWESGPINLSKEEKNPAVKVDIYQSGELKYSQWAFKNVPFFGLGAGHPGSAPKDIAFTLESYSEVIFAGNDTKKKGM